MPTQSIFRIVKRWRRYQVRGDWKPVPGRTRGLYVLYQAGSSHEFQVVYIGVAGLGKGGTGSIRSRLRRHHRETKKWTHYSAFEVHDNITREEIKELEALLLAIFRHDRRIGLTNKQKGSKRLYELRRRLAWKEA